MRSPFALLALTSTLALAACGGGGGGSSSPVVPAGPPPTAFARGTVVDTASAAPLSGVNVTLSPFTVGAAPIARTTTDATGAFSLGVATAGTYLLTVGSDSSTDLSRATFHLPVTLAVGNNAVSAPSPTPVRDAVYTAAQQSGAFRLAALNANEQNCITGANTGRIQNNLPQLVMDELLLEDARAGLAEEVAQDTDVPTPLWPFPAPGSYIFSFRNTPEEHSEQHFPTCAQWTGPDYAYVKPSPQTFPNPSYGAAMNPNYVWFGVTFGNAAPGSSANTYGLAVWTVDQRT